MYTHISKNEEKTKERKKKKETRPLIGNNTIGPIWWIKLMLMIIKYIKSRAFGKNTCNSVELHVLARSFDEIAISFALETDVVKRNAFAWHAFATLQLHSHFWITCPFYIYVFNIAYLHGWGLYYIYPIDKYINIFCIYLNMNDNIRVIQK